MLHICLIMFRRVWVSPQRVAIGSNTEERQSEDVPPL